MAKTQYHGANITLQNPFHSLMTRSNELAHDMATIVVTATPNSQPDDVVGGVTSGNVLVNGIFSANSLVAIDGLRGGSVSVPGNLNVVSNTIFDGGNLIHVRNTHANVQIDAVTVNVTSNINVNANTRNFSVRTANTVFHAGQVSFLSNTLFAAPQMTINVPTVTANSLTMGITAASNVTVSAPETYIGASGAQQVTVRGKLTAASNVEMNGVRTQIASTETQIIGSQLAVSANTMFDANDFTINASNVAVSASSATVVGNSNVNISAPVVYLGTSGVQSVTVGAKAEFEANTIFTGGSLLMAVPSVSASSTTFSVNASFSVDVSAPETYIGASGAQQVTVRGKLTAASNVEMNGVRTQIASNTLNVAGSDALISSNTIFTKPVVVGTPIEPSHAMTVGSADSKYVAQTSSIGTGANLSTISVSGFYKLSGAHPDTPDDVLNGQMIVSGAAGGLVQFAFPTTLLGQPHYRVGTGPATLSSWAPMVTADNISDYIPPNIVTDDRTIIAGAGLSGGGSLAADRTISVQAGNGLSANASGVHIGPGAGISVSTSSISVRAGNGLLSNTTGVHVIAGDGITTTGSSVSVVPGAGLSANSTGVHVGAGNGIAVSGSSVSVVAGNGLASNSTGIHVSTGDGITVSSGALRVDTTVVRTSGNQTIAGMKTLSSGITLGDLITTTSGNLALYPAGSSSVVIRSGATAAGATVTLNTAGITTNRTLTFGNGDTTLVPGTMTPTNRQITAGNGLSGGGNFESDRTLTVSAGNGISVDANGVHVKVANGVTITEGNVTLDDTVVRTSGNQTIAGSKSFSSVISGSVSGTATALATARTFTIGGTARSFNGTAPVAWSLGDIGAAPAAGSGSITTLGTITSGEWCAGNVLIPNGTNAAPSLSFAGDTDTGFTWSGTNTLGVVTGGTLAAQFLSNGNLSIFNNAGTFASTIQTNPTADRTLTLPDSNVVLVGGTMVPTTVQIVAGNGLTGGGNLAANRTLAVGAGDGITVAATTVGVDGTVVRTSGNQTIAGEKSFSGTLISSNVGNGGWGLATTPAGLTMNVATAANAAWSTKVLNSSGVLLGGLQFNLGTNQTRLYTSASDYIQFDGSLIADAHLSTNIVRNTISITAGAGLNGGGNLAANRTLAVGAGDGITVNATNIAVNTTVVRTTGNQTIAGSKTFSTVPTCAAAPTADNHLANKAYVDSAGGWNLVHEMNWNVSADNTFKQVYTFPADDMGHYMVSVIDWFGSNPSASGQGLFYGFRWQGETAVPGNADFTRQSGFIPGTGSSQRRFAQMEFHRPRESIKLRHFSIIETAYTTTSNGTDGYGTMTRTFISPTPKVIESLWLRNENTGSTGSGHVRIYRK